MVFDDVALDEIFDVILQYIKIKDIILWRRVSKHWNSFINDEFIWKCIEVQFNTVGVERCKSWKDAILWFTENQYYNEELCELSNGNICVYRSNRQLKLLNMYGVELMILEHWRLIKKNRIYLEPYRRKLVIGRHDVDGQLIDEFPFRDAVGNSSFHDHVCDIDNDFIFISRGVHDMIKNIFMKISDKYYVSLYYKQHLLLYDKKFNPIVGIGYYIRSYVTSDGIINAIIAYKTGNSMVIGIDRLNVIKSFKDADVFSYDDIVLECKYVSKFSSTEIFLIMYKFHDMTLSELCKTNVVNLHNGKVIDFAIFGNNLLIGTSNGYIMKFEMRKTIQSVSVMSIMYIKSKRFGLKMDSFSILKSKRLIYFHDDKSYIVDIP